MRRLIPILLLVFAASLHAQSFDLVSSYQSVVSLDGQWRFHAGNDERWADPALDDSQWPLLSSTRPWSEQGYPAMSGHAWYRFTVRVPAGEHPLAIFLPPIYTGYQLWVDGRLAGHTGHLTHTLLMTETRAQVFPLSLGVRPHEQTVHFALHVWHEPIWAAYMGGGPQFGGALAGDAALIAARLQLQSTRTMNFNVDLYISAILRGLIGLVILGLFIFRRTERAFLWFALSQLFGCCEDALEFAHNAYGVMPIMPYDLADAIGSAAFWIASMLFVASILAPRRGFWFRLSLVLALASPLATPLYWWGWLSVPVSSALTSVLVVPSLVWVIVVLVRRALRRDPDAILLVGPIVLVNTLYLVSNAVLDAGQLGWISILVDLFSLRIPMRPYPISYYSIFNTFYLLALLVFLVRRFALARRREEKLQSQIEAASQVQALLVPEASPSVPGFKIESVYLPAESVGGDFFVCVPDSAGGLLVVIGDVAGKGLPAAMLVSMLVGTIRAEARHTGDPAVLLAILNDRLLERAHGAFATCLALHIAGDGHCSVANAAHLAPHIAGDEVALPSALPLGIVPAVQYEPVALLVHPGQTLTLLSDGVIEAQSPTGELFGFERTLQISTQPAAAIARAAQQFGQEDDITVLTLTFAPAEVLHV